MLLLKRQWLMNKQQKLLLLTKLIKLQLSRKLMKSTMPISTNKDKKPISGKKNNQLNPMLKLKRLETTLMLPKQELQQKEKRNSLKMEEIPAAGKRMHLSILLIGMMDGHLFQELLLHHSLGILSMVIAMATSKTCPEQIKTFEIII